MDKKKGILLSIIGILGVALITTGITFAFFNYAKEGTTENTITSGTINFLYTEVDGQGRGISITDALPMSDEDGIAMSASNEYFDFKITASTSGIEIPYIITAEKDAASTMLISQVKLYLTKTDGEGALVTSETPVPNSVGEYGVSFLGDGYSSYDSSPNEFILHTDTVPANTPDYEQNYRLRMWLGDTDSYGGNIEYSAKEFILLSKTSGNDPIDFALAEHYMITSSAYYELSATEKANYERIKYINYTDKKMYSVSQATRLGLTEAPNGYTESEQYYPLNNKLLKVKVNVYAEGNVVAQANAPELVGLAKTIHDSNTIKTGATTLEKSNVSNENGLYSSTATNTGNPTYFFRGDVENNYVSFAGMTWRIVRINEDGTVRLILNDNVNELASENEIVNLFTQSNYKNYYPQAEDYYDAHSIWWDENEIYSADYFIPKSNQYITASISNDLNSWYQTNLASYSSKIATGNYFCQQAKAAVLPNLTAGNVALNNYTSNFRCSNDANGYGLVNSNIGLISLDEGIHAGANQTSKSYLLKDYNLSELNNYDDVDLLVTTTIYNGIGIDYIENIGTFNNMILPIGNIPIGVRMFCMGTTDDRGNCDGIILHDKRVIRPVINLKANVEATGTGTSADPYVVQ